MYTLDETISKTIKERLDDGQRVISLKLPYGEVYTNYLNIPDYKLYYWDNTKDKLCFRNDKTKIIFKFLFWLAEVVLFALQCILQVPVDPMSVLALTGEFAELSIQFFDTTSNINNDVFKSLSKHIKIKKRPCKEYKKIKKVFYIFLDKNTSKDLYNTALLLADLVNNGYVDNLAVVFLSTVDLKNPHQELLKLDGLSEEENEFACNFGRDILVCIRDKRYADAAIQIGKFISNQGLENADIFNFAMQCLSFCYERLNEADFRRLFEENEINIHEELNFGKNNNFIENLQINNSFLRFCYGCLQHYYRKSSGVHSNSLDDNFLQIVKAIQSNLVTNNDYYSAAQLFAKFGGVEETVDAYILAYVHSQYVNYSVSDEILLAIEQYSLASSKAKLFLQLHELNKEENPDPISVKSFIAQVENIKFSDPILKICFYYYLVNPIYKSDCCDVKFMRNYISAYTSLNSQNKAFRCLFGAQFLLLYTTIEDVELRNKFGKSVDTIFHYVRENIYLIKDKVVYFKIYRSLNGIYVDRFHENLRQMLSIKKNVAVYEKENILYNINLGATYAFCGDYKSALTTYKNLKKKQLNLLPLYVKASHQNNFAVLQYLDNPTVDNAKILYKQTDDFLRKFYDEKTVTEETRHLAINRALFAILGQLPSKLIQLAINEANALCDDNYFKFYMQQAQWLYNVLRHEQISEEIIESVFFSNKISFFEQKIAVMNSATDIKQLSVGKLNAILKEELSDFDDDYDYFKNAAVFSLVERWYE
ncbi:MAG: hypothetical protein J1F65_05460 [Clostridiales bacterium]|nr:hypothetical protein [Clostridiales bacterium]